VAKTESEKTIFWVTGAGKKNFHVCICKALCGCISFIKNSYRTNNFCALLAFQTFLFWGFKRHQVWVNKTNSQELRKKKIIIIRVSFVMCRRTVKLKSFICMKLNWQKSFFMLSVYFLDWLLFRAKIFLFSWMKINSNGSENLKNSY
jgi:hypothetical protein